MNHTPTPWKIVFGHIQDKNGEIVFHQSSLMQENGSSVAEMEANAKFIVTAVNAHDELVNLLKAINAHRLYGDLNNKIEQALKSAGAE